MKESFESSVPVAPFQLLQECGCASKMDGCALNRLLTAARLPAQILESPIDAAAVASPATELLVTVDGGSPVFPEPVVAGRIAFNHAASDIFARGGEASYATIFLSAATDLPRETLAAFLRGIQDAADGQSCAIVNGHTAIGDSAGLRYAITIIGRSISRRTLGKHGAKVGDALYLSKPIVGSVVLKALVLDVLTAEQVRAVGELLSVSNLRAARAALQANATACTDVTGFGLLGSLAEMLPNLGARLKGHSLPIFPGTKAMLVAVGATNSAVGNRRYAAQRHRLAIGDPFHAAVAADAVTAGPLLVSVPRESGPVLEAAGFVAVGEVVAEPVLAID